tara:strand:- start:276 stop:386 length:111 start_codon:yes stop_codon:yes gene_type:complete
MKGLLLLLLCIIIIKSNQIKSNDDILLFCGFSPKSS